MAVIAITEPDNVNEDIYDAVQEKLGLQGDPPEGLIVHTAGTDAGQFRVIDVWESREAHDRFRDERLLPAIREVASERGLEPPSGPPSGSWYDAHDFQVLQGAATQ
jgi:hypothetical protein